MQRDVVAVMSDHHQVLSELMDQLLALQSSPTYRLLFDEFTKGTGAMLRSMDLSIIPLLKSQGWKRVSSQLLREHVELKHQLGELLTARFDTPAYAAALKAMALKMRRQQRIAVEQLFPWLETVLDEEQRKRLGTEVQEHLSSLLGDERRDAGEHEAAGVQRSGHGPNAGPLRLDRGPRAGATRWPSCRTPRTRRSWRVRRAGGRLAPRPSWTCKA